MTIDSSAIVAIVFREPAYLELVDGILEADVVRAGAPTRGDTLLFVGDEFTHTDIMPALR